MQKNYRDYTVGELLDMGLKVDVYNHRVPSKEKAEQMLSRFEGLKNSSHLVEPKERESYLVVNGWEGNFEITNFITLKK